MLTPEQTNKAMDRLRDEIVRFKKPLLSIEKVLDQCFVSDSNVNTRYLTKAQKLAAYYEALKIIKSKGAM